MRVIYKINGQEIVHENIADVVIYPDGDKVTHAYIVMKTWVQGFKRWEYPHVYSKPDSIFIENEA